jgi:predicted outer membrane repeat protein
MSLKRRTLPYLALLLLISIYLTSCSQAAVINVGCDVDDLIAAINSANANSDTTKLILDPNCTYAFQNKDNTDGGQGPNALPTITTKIVVEGNNATLLRSTSFGFRFFFITGSGSLRLEDITLEHGYALKISAEQPSARGGAIYNDSGGLRAERSVFRDNYATHGGAIYNLGILTLEDTLFEINFSDNGGAIYNGGNMDIAAILQDVTFDSNGASDNGGAIYNASAEQGFLITGSTFDNNSSYELHGGAIYMEAGDLEIYNSDFLENTSGSNAYPTGDGGAIYSLAGDVSLITNNFIGNRAYGVGGMIYAGPGSNVRLREVRSEADDACHGGGALYVEGETEILQSTFENNRAGGLYIIWNLPHYLLSECEVAHGGAIYNAGTLTLDQSLLDDFVAEEDGDGIYNLGNLTVLNSTFNRNICSTAEAINNHGTADLSFSTFVYSNLVNSGTMTVKNIIVTNCTGSCINLGSFADIGDNIALDPACPFSIILANFSELNIDSALSDNGGPTLTHRVSFPSPVFNMASCSTVSGDPVNVDQRGVTRPIPPYSTSYCDIGAFELDDFSPPPPPLPPPPLPPTPTLDSGSEPAPSCDPFEETEISLILLNLPGNTRNLPVYLKVAEGIFPGFDSEELNGEPTFQYSAKLGEIQAYQVSQQGFPERLYFMFHIPEGMEGTAQLFKLRLPDCEDPVYEQANVLIPVPKVTDFACSADLSEKDCKAAGGVMSGKDTPSPYCSCP